MTYDGIGRLIVRKIVAAGVPDEFLTLNYYDQPVTGYYNIGRLTKSYNPARTQELNYSAHGLVKYKIETDSAGSHYTYVNLYFDGRCITNHTGTTPASLSPPMCWTMTGSGGSKPFRA